MRSAACLPTSYWSMAAPLSAGADQASETDNGLPSLTETVPGVPGVPGAAAVTGVGGVAGVAGVGVGFSCCCPVSSTGGVNALDGESSDRAAATDARVPGRAGDDFGCWLLDQHRH